MKITRCIISKISIIKFGKSITFKPIVHVHIDLLLGRIVLQCKNFLINVYHFFFFLENSFICIS